MAVYIGDKNITEVLAGNALDSAKQYADQGDANTLQQAKDYTDSEVSQFEADYKQADATVLSEAKQYADQNMIPKSQKGQPGGLAELDETGRVPSSQLPSYVDDVIDVDTYSNLPNPGESGKIYITTDNNKQYRWSGTGYAEISSSLALGTTSETAGRGDWTQAAYNHSLITNGSNPHGTTFASLPDKPTSLPANGGNADTVDNLHANDFAQATQTPYVDIDTINGRGITGIGENAQATAERHYPIQEAGALFYSRSANYSANQIYGTFNSNRWFVRGGGNGPSEKTPWAEIWTNKNLTKLSQLQDDVVAGKYLPLTGGVLTGILICPNDSACIAHSNKSGAALIQFIAGKTVIGSIDSQTYASTHIRSISGHVTVGTSATGDVNTMWDSGNLNPVTIDSDQIITGWKRFTPKTKNGVYNTSGIIGDKDVYGTPLSWNVSSDGSFWHIQQYSNTIALIGLQGGKPFQIRSTIDEISVTADKFNGTASNILDRSDNSSKSIWTGTQAEYDAISTKDSNTIYFIV